MRRLRTALERPSGRERSARYLLGLDFDGTLAPLARRPGLAQLPPYNRRLLARLSRLRRARVAIVSGRALIDVRDKVGVDGITYVGNHGLEIQSPDGRVWVHPQARRCEPLMKRLSRRLAQEVSDFPGVFVEDKGVTLSVHYRLMPRYLSPRPLHERIRLLVAGQRHRVRLTKGKKVWEIRPRLQWNKGFAMRRLLGLAVGDWIPVFIGDDYTDEEGFKSLGPEAITVRVGYKKDSHARYRLKSQRQVAPMLEYFLREWR